MLFEALRVLDQRYPQKGAEDHIVNVNDYANFGQTALYACYLGALEFDDKDKKKRKEERRNKRKDAKAERKKNKGRKGTEKEGPDQSEAEEMQAAIDDVKSGKKGGMSQAELTALSIEARTKKKRELDLEPQHDRVLEMLLSRDANIHLIEDNQVSFSSLVAGCSSSAFACDRRVMDGAFCILVPSEETPRG